MIDWSKLQGFADDKVNVTEKLKLVNKALHQVIKNNRVSLKIDNQSNSLDIFTADSKLPSYSCNRERLSIFQVKTPVTVLIQTYF